MALLAWEAWSAAMLSQEGRAGLPFPARGLSCAMSRPAAGIHASPFTAVCGGPSHTAVWQPAADAQCNRQVPTADRIRPMQLSGLVVHGPRTCKPLGAVQMLAWNADAESWLHRTCPTSSYQAWGMPQRGGRIDSDGV